MGDILPSWYSISFMVADDGVDEDTIMLTLRDSTFDSDMLSLIVLASEEPGVETVYVAASDMDTYHERHGDIEEELSELDVHVEPVIVDSSEFVTAITESRLVFLRNETDLLDYQLLNRNPDRKFVVLFHGLAKASGVFRERNIGEKGVSIARPYRRFQSIDLYTVSTDTEMFYRTAAEEIHPLDISRCGYPKFTRLEHLSENLRDAVLSKETQGTLDSEDTRYRVLYAPTHKGRYEKTELFPYPEFDVDDLRSFLDSLDAELYIRMHVNEEDEGIYDEVIDGNCIRYAGQGFSPSATEVLPFFDLLITDHSSIYTEYLALDRPIVFAIDESHPYWSDKGLIFEDEALAPGPKPDSYSDLKRAIERGLEGGDDGYGEDREFAKRALLPDPDVNYLDCVLGETT